MKTSKNLEKVFEALRNFEEIRKTKQKFACIHSPTCSYSCVLHLQARETFYNTALHLQFTDIMFAKQ